MIVSLFKIREIRWWPISSPRLLSFSNTSLKVKSEGVIQRRKALSAQAFLPHLSSDLPPSNIRIDCRLMKRNFMLSDTLQQSMIQPTHSHTHWVSPMASPYPTPGWGNYCRESPCIDCPFSTRTLHTYMSLSVYISHALQQHGNTAASSISNAH